MLNPAPSPTAIEGEILAKLLVAASATLESDLATAKACIQRASALLPGCREGDMQRARGKAVVQGGLAPWREKRVAAYVEANIGSRIRAAELAHVAHLSPAHFSRCFRRSFGESPLSYITKRRVRRSQALMQGSGAPLSQIALECGLSDQSHFSRVFHKVVGVTPSLWRQQVALEAPQRSFKAPVSSSECLP